MLQNAIMRSMDFETIFHAFVESKEQLKVISVASCSKEAKPNSAPKMLIDIVLPNKVYFLDYNHTRSYSNIHENPELSVSFMSDAAFTGYRLNGIGEILAGGPEFAEAKNRWEKRLIAYEADRIIQRIQGLYSTKQSENSLPKDFVIVKLTAAEGSVVKPDRVFRAAATSQRKEK